MSEHLKAEHIKRSLAIIKDFLETIDLEGHPRGTIEKKEKTQAALAQLNEVILTSTDPQDPLPRDCTGCHIQEDPTPGVGAPTYDPTNPHTKY